MHAKPDLRVFLKWMIARSGSVITDLMSLEESMSRKQDSGVCDKCSASFDYFLLHNGFNNSAYAYCSESGCVAILNGYCDQIPAGVELTVHRSINAEIEIHLECCKCGGTFRSSSAPCCPSCKKRLSADAARAYIEQNAPGTAKGFRWQNNWSGLYCVIVDQCVVYDNWKLASAT